MATLNPSQRGAIYAAGTGSVRRSLPSQLRSQVPGQPPALPPIGQFHAFVTDAEPAVHLSEDTTPVPNSAWKAAKAAARERRRERRALATPRGTVTAPTWRAPPPLPPDTPR